MVKPELRAVCSPQAPLGGWKYLAIKKNARKTCKSPDQRGLLLVGNARERFHGIKPMVELSRRARMFDWWGGGRSMYLDVRLWCDSTRASKTRQQ